MIPVMKRRAIFWGSISGAILLGFVLWYTGTTEKIISTLLAQGIVVFILTGLLLYKWKTTRDEDKVIRIIFYILCMIQFFDVPIGHDPDDPYTYQREL